MSAGPDEIIGLTQSIAYAEHLAAEAGLHGPDGNEGYLARLAGCRVTGTGLTTGHTMQEAFAVAATAAAAHADELTRQKNIQEQYDVNPEAGDKTYLTSAAGEPAERDPTSVNAPREADMTTTDPAPGARRGHYNPDQPRAGDGKWTADAATEVPDVLDEVDEKTCFGSDVVAGLGLVTTELRLMDYSSQGDQQEVPFVSVSPSRERGDTYAEPHLSPDEAEQAAEHLEELAAQAEAGYTPPKPTKYARSAQRVRQMLATDDVTPGDRVPIGYDDDTLPITYNDLLKLLTQADPQAAGGPRRSVRAQASRDSGGEDGLVVMDLAADRDGTRVTVLAMEGVTSDPDDSFWDKYRAAHTPGQARELAGKLRTFAHAARAHASGDRD
jgi:hypothetical protein